MRKEIFSVKWDYGILSQKGFLVDMWDPLSIFFCMWILNIGMPEARLSVADTIELREQELINKTITSSVELRVNYDYKNY